MKCSIHSTGASSGVGKTLIALLVITFLAGFVFPAAAEAASGTIKVRAQINGAAGAPAGSQFKISRGWPNSWDSGWINLPTNGSYYTVNNIPTGDYIARSYNIEYSSVSGYGTPSSNSVYLSKNETESVTGNYTQPMIKVEGDLDGSGNPPAGAQFRITRDGGGFDSGWLTLTGGDTAVIVPQTGIYTISYSLVANYWKPFDESVHINNMADVDDVTGNYKTRYHSISEGGRIRVSSTINGSAGAPAGAQFRIIHNGGRFITSWINLNADGSYVEVNGLDADVFGQSYTVEYTQNPPGYSGSPSDTTTLYWTDKTATENAEYTINSHTVTFAAGANGSVTNNGANTVAHGGSISSTATASPGYHFVNWTGSSTTTTNPLNLTNVTTNLSYTANFAINTYTITASAGANGSISPNGGVVVNHGSNQAFTITPASVAYEIDQVLVDGVNNPAAVASGSYTFTNVTANHTISATFKLKTYTITASAGANGSISPSGTVLVNHGANQAFTITPASVAYEIDQVLVDGVNNPGAVSSGSYTFTNVTASHTISASFKIKTYTVTFVAGANGSVTNAGGNTVNHGSGISSTATANSGYHFVNWTKTGGGTSTDNPLNLTNVTESQTWTANFAINEYTVTFVAGANGSVTNAGGNTVNHGSSIGSTATANVGYHFVNWTKSGGGSSTDNPLNLTNVTGDQTWTANFAINQYNVDFIAGPNGSLSGTDPQLVNHGSDATPVTAVPNPGYYFVNWTAGEIEDSGGRATHVEYPGGFPSTANPLTVTNVTQDLTVTANFAREMGTLNVTPTFNGAAASYSISGPADFAPVAGLTGNYSQVVPSGVYTVTFTTDPVYDLAVGATTFTVGATTAAGTLAKDQVETVTAVYTRHVGSLMVTILPAEAVADGAQWRIFGQAGWRNSGTTASGIPTGNNIQVELKAVEGWNAPTTPFVNITKNNTTKVTVTYTESLAGTGSLTLSFAEAMSAADGGQWRLVNPPAGVAPSAGAWHNHGDTIANMPQGSYQVEYKTIAGWIKPHLKSVKVNPGIANKHTAEYVRPLIVHKSDYDGNGTEDLAVYNAKTRKWSVASAGKPGAAPSATTILEKRYGKAGDIMAPGDYDGDGSADLAYWREETGEWAVRGQFKLKKFGTERDIPVPGDYDGDGRTEPALFRPSTGEWLLYSYETEKVQKVQFGEFGDIPVPGNYDGDAAGRTDLAVWNVETGMWEVAIYDVDKQKWIASKRYSGKHGIDSDIPVQGDYDGDGKTDLAVYERGTSTWKVKGQFELEFGEAGDLPVPNDWAGLGRVIPAVFRTVNGKWLAIDNLLSARYGQGGQPLVSGR